MRPFIISAAPLLACLLHATTLRADPVPIELVGDQAALRSLLAASPTSTKIAPQGEGTLVLSSTLGLVTDSEAEWKALPNELVEMVPAAARGPENQWIAIAANPRCLIYRPSVIQIDDLPDGLDRLDDPEWKQRVGWVPTDAGFQTMIGVMAILQGEDKTLQWLKSMQQNGTRTYASAEEAIAALSKGEIDGVLGSVQAGYSAIGADPEADLKTYIFAEGDAGSFIDYVTVSSRSEPDAEAAAWLKEMLGSQGQALVAKANYYPVASDVKANEALQPMDTIMAPKVEPAQFQKLGDGTELLRKAGLIN